MKGYVTLYRFGSESDKLRFEDVIDFTEELWCNRIRFTYRSASTGALCFASFDIKSLVGYTYTVPGPPST